ncbi:cytochrome P450 [Nocardiopsis gilva YIM 90087]|uniref:Cytochrome P450 n=1 Tax=Nocardiopsis gilva YIM 90087 TaxID=1235441 RepID=A0A223S7C4_9ACTN|nr:cytochrome P450 [Nocardiopsis gilva]ASU84014.1 cytochrome P450 [Nocardiopsis gilva YIM 90087]
MNATNPTPTGADDRIDLGTPELTRDPFTAYSKLREQGAVLPGKQAVIGDPTWIVTRYDDVKTVLADARFVKDRTSIPGFEADDSRFRFLTAFGLPEEYMGYMVSLLDLDGEEHTRLRKLVSRTFTVRRISELRPRMEEIVDGLLDRLPEQADENGVVDLLNQFGYPFSMTVICELVGIDEEDRAAWLGFGEQLGSEDPAEFAGAVRGVIDHVHALIERRRNEPAEDLLTGLIRTHDEDGDRLTDAEMVTMIFTLVMAGYGTTASFIANGTVDLLTHPDQFELLKREPELMPRAVHELLRRVPPAQLVGVRYAAEDVEIGGTTIKQGDGVTAILGAANFDPRQFDEPDTLDIRRESAGRRETHVSFSHGAHYCLGAALARQESEVAFTKLFERFPNIMLAVGPSELPRSHQPGAWMLEELPVRL